MQPEARRFIDLEIRPYEGEPELRQEVEAADTLTKADSHPHRRKWRIALYLIKLMLSLPCSISWLANRASRPIRQRCTGSGSH